VKRSLATFSVLIAVALAATGCNSSSTSSVVAKVNSTSITTGTLDSVMSALKGDSALLCASKLGTHPVTTGVAAGTWNSTYAGFVLEQLIKFEVLAQLVAAHHLYVPGSDLSAAKTEAEAGLQTAGATGCTGTATAVDDAGTVFETAYVRNQLYEDAYAAYLAGISLKPAVLKSWEQAHQGATLESCTSVIQVATESLAVKLEAAIRGGASFATEANTNTQSTGTGKGGVVGCVLEKQWSAGLGPTVSALQVGVVSQPVHYQSSWLLFLVTKRVPEPLDGLLAILQIDESARFNQQYATAFTRANITVSPVYGTWRVAVSKAGISASLVPPSDKACAYSPAASAAGCVPTTTLIAASSTGSG
jgi:hypothetical protein